MATEKWVERKVEYAVGGSQKISLEIVVGQGQVGGCTLDWESDFYPLWPGKPKDISSTQGSLANRKASLVAVVKDVQNNTNLTVITLGLKGGTADREISFQEDAPEDRGKVIYLISVALVEA